MSRLSRLARVFYGFPENLPSKQAKDRVDRGEISHPSEMAHGEVVKLIEGCGYREKNRSNETAAYVDSFSDEMVTVPKAKCGMVPSMALDRIARTVPIDSLL